MEFMISYEFTPPQKKPGRHLVSTILLTAALCLTAGACDDDNSDAKTAATYGATPSDQSYYGSASPNRMPNMMPKMDAFSNPETQKIAESLGITTESYFKLTPETAKSATKSGLFAQLDEPLADIYFPSVMDYRDIIENAAKEAGVPPNILAILATIESAGVVRDQANNADAYGLVQVVPRYHFDKFAPYLPDNASYEDYRAAKAGDHSNVSLDEYVAVFSDPEINAGAGAAYLKECIDAAHTNFPALDKNSIAIYGWAAAAYNGGIGNMGRGFDDMPKESKMYVDHMARIVLDVEVALRLRDERMAPDEVLAAMQSEEMNARIYAFGEVYPELMTYNDAVDAGAGEIPSEEFASYRDEYLTLDEPLYTTPVTPGMRMWINSGGIGLFQQGSRNMSWTLDR
jgi:hypothetical protein